jgi:hypothetical protein
VLIATGKAMYSCGDFWIFSRRSPENPVQINEHFRPYSSRPERIFYWYLWQGNSSGTVIRENF